MNGSDALPPHWDDQRRTGEDHRARRERRRTERRLSAPRHSTAFAMQMAAQLAPGDGPSGGYARTAAPRLRPGLVTDTEA